jgi:hypothetical protein
MYVGEFMVTKVEIRPGKVGEISREYENLMLIIGQYKTLILPANEERTYHAFVIRVGSGVEVESSLRLEYEIFFTRDLDELAQKLYRELYEKLVKSAKWDPNGEKATFYLLSPEVKVVIKEMLEEFQKRILASALT